jgi:tetratricopeptide (TPR) repeat protein
MRGLAVVVLLWACLTLALSVAAYQRTADDAVFVSTVVSMAKAEDAVKALQQYLLRKPADGLAWFQLGKELLRTNVIYNQHTALDSFAKALELIPDGPDKAQVLVELGRAFQETQNDMHKALMLYAAATAMAPNSDDVHLASVSAYMAMLEPVNALSHLMVVIQRALPKRMALQYQYFGDVFSRVEDFETVLELLGQCFKSCSWPSGKPDYLKNLQLTMLKVVFCLALSIL